MGIKSLTHRDDGSKVAVPASQDDWRQWVSAGQTRNWMLGDPLIDWLQLYGRSHEYIPKQQLATYDKDLDFLDFVLEKSKGFESGILRLFREKYDVATIAANYQEIGRIDKAEETFETMRQGVPIIHQAVLWDAHNMNYGSPDFLVRSDVLHCLFSESISDQEATTTAPDLGVSGWHYLVVDTKFTTLYFNANGTEISMGIARQPTRLNCTSTTECWGVCRVSNRPHLTCWDVAGNRRARGSLDAAPTLWTAWDRFHRTELSPTRFL